MTIELKIPDVGESVQEVEIGRWLKQEGDSVAEDEFVVELETDKASMELPAPAAGVLAEILKREGDAVAVGDLIARIEKSDGDDDQPESDESADEDDEDIGESQPESPEVGDDETEQRQEESQPSDPQPVFATPAARRALRKHGLTADEVKPAGKRLRPEDVERYVREEQTEDKKKQSAKEESPANQAHGEKTDRGGESDLEQVVPMSLIRRRIAARLVEAQQQAALLTTFNEIDLSAVLELRQEYREKFEEEFGVPLGFMPFFVKAVIDALRHFPEVNAEIRDVEGKLHVAHRDYHHIGVAIGGGKGLVVPVLRFAERLSFAEIEEAIEDFANRAESNQLQPDELEGGTFTITNGGVYGSLLSTPIVNPPQSGVLGMHAIQERPVAVDGQVVIHPMMYVALTYDHRLVDGREAVLFLKRVKEAIEEPARMLIEV